ncbi:CASP-like protein 4A3 isoform X1 [Amaranthus tricolor]|uniref:CASP-like protein 4A3 isoform X1 n=1 Tax=Amaranthus tricolor TaxID=29722 RepID=UPI00258DC4A2|nr:CASP-like protein 4A3 isoform X1 [Amaranthus tricolor]
MQNHQKPPFPPPPLSVSQPPPKLKRNSFSNSDDSSHSPLRSDSPLNSDSPIHDLDQDHSNHGGAIVAVEKFYSPVTSPFPKEATTPDNCPFSTPPPQPLPLLQTQPHHTIHFNRREEVPPQTGVVTEERGGERKGRVGVRFGGVEDISARNFKKRGAVLDKVNLGLRVLEIVFCLISFAVMAADKTQGWSGDSFDRYKEYRFCLSVTILGFLYSAFQACDVAKHLATGKHVINHHLRYQFEFIMDQILAYLLISSSSAAASRADDWQSNWGKDEFTEKASASISMAFLAFLGFAMSSLISGYNLCNRDLS